MYNPPFNYNEKYLRVFPAVVPADKESTVTVTSFDDNLRFWDDITYDVEFIPKDNSDVPLDGEVSMLGYEKSRKVYKVKPENGRLHLTYFFAHEQEWIIRISTKEYAVHENPMYAPAQWPWMSDHPKQGFEVSLYSLKSDLYGRLPMKGDLHLHTSISDGEESPEFTAAAYRRAGFDFIAITDHYAYSDAKELNEKFDIVNGFSVLPAEEVHNKYMGLIHMVNLGSKSSVNDLLLNDPDYISERIEFFRENTEIPDGVDEKEYLLRTVIYDEIKKSGGIAIFPHPMWQLPSRFNASVRTSMAVLENGLCAASGGLLCEYVNGDPELKDAICSIEEKLNRYDKEFFGI